MSPASRSTGLEVARQDREHSARELHGRATAGKLVEAPVLGVEVLGVGDVAGERHELRTEVAEVGWCAAASSASRSPQSSASSWSPAPPPRSPPAGAVPISAVVADLMVAERESHGPAPASPTRQAVATRSARWLRWAEATSAWPQELQKRG